MRISDAVAPLNPLFPTHMPATLDTIIIYARNPIAMATFYCRYFDYHSSGIMEEGLITLSPTTAGATLLIHQAAKSIKLGHAGLKLMFSVEDVEAYKAKSAALGLEFGSTHQAQGYCFANVKDPDGNSISISSRAFRVTPESLT